MSHFLSHFWRRYVPLVGHGVGKKAATLLGRFGYLNRPSGKQGIKNTLNRLPSGVPLSGGKRSAVRYVAHQLPYPK